MTTYPQSIPPELAMAVFGETVVVNDVSQTGIVTLNTFVDGHAQIEQAITVTVNAVEILAPIGAEIVVREETYRVQFVDDGTDPVWRTYVAV